MIAAGAMTSWFLVGLATHVLGAIAASTVGIWLAGRRHRLGGSGTLVVFALTVTALWSLLAASASGSLLAGAGESVRNLVWLMVLYRLFANDGRHTSMAPIRPLVGALAFVEAINLVIVLFAGRVEAANELVAITANFHALFRLLVTIGALMLVHNLFAGASPPARTALRWPAAGLAIMWIFDLNLYALAYMRGTWPVELAAVRGLVALALALTFAIAGADGRDEFRLRPSRAVTFQTFSLLVIGAYLAMMVAIAKRLSWMGGDFARVMELGFLTLASAGALFLLPSKRLRGWAKVMLTKHLFQHRYDYREEWLRFTRTMGRGGPDALPLGERAVQALAEIAECPAGLLLAPGDDGGMELAARWNWPEIDVPASAMPAEALGCFEREGFIADLDDIRAGRLAGFDAALMPGWLLGHPRAWALVPLVLYERLIGVVVLARPHYGRKLDWEDFDLLRVGGQQLASYLAENSSQLALAEASRFDDFHRRIAFVMHDIKNLASQLSLLARNAELHAEKKEFRDDMLVTLRNSAEKLNALIARLSRYGTGAIDSMGEVSAAQVARSVMERFATNRQVMLAQCEDMQITANSEALEQVLVHLIQNGLDASNDGTPVFLSLTAEDLHARFEVLDSGCGMSPEFARTKLFKPFVSTKTGGFGIGAFEARELVRSMRGRLEVESREGLGSRFAVRIPAAVSSRQQKIEASEERKMAS